MPPGKALSSPVPFQTRRWQKIQFLFIFSLQSAFRTSFHCSYHSDFQASNCPVVYSRQKAISCFKRMLFRKIIKRSSDLLFIYWFWRSNFLFLDVGSKREQDSQSTTKRIEIHQVAWRERVVSPLSGMKQNLIPYSSWSLFFFKFFISTEALQKWSKIQIIFLSVVFFGNHSAVDIDVQTCIQPRLRELYMGKLLPAGNTHLSSGSSFILQVENFFGSQTWPSKCQVQGCQFKWYLFFNKAHPDSLWSFFTLPLKMGAWVWTLEPSGFSSPRLWTLQPRQCFSKPTYLSGEHLTEAFSLWYGLALNSIQMVVLSSFIKGAGSFS